VYHSAAFPDKPLTEPHRRTREPGVLGKKKRHRPFQNDREMCLGKGKNVRVPLVKKTVKQGKFRGQEQRKVNKRSKREKNSV